MAFEEGEAQFECPACNALHTAKWSRMIVREQSTLRCQACNEIMYQGNSARDFYGLALVAVGGPSAADD
jgi:transcription elongation factor Elf1